jgi:hypothetical protein
MRKRRRLSKKELEQREQQEAERESKARNDSEDRQQKIKVLWGFEKKELKKEKLKKQKLIDLLHSASLTKNDDLKDRVGELVELVGLQDCEIEYLGQFRRDVERMREHYPNELQNLIGKSWAADWDELNWDELIKIGNTPKLPEPTPTQKFEWKRGGYRWSGGVGLIEYEFGGAGEAAWNQPFAPLFGLPYQPTCLDDIFAGKAVSVRSQFVIVQVANPFFQPGRYKPGLQELFGMERHRLYRFLEKIPSVKKGRERLYDYRAVVKIMDALLKEEPAEHKKSLRGKTRRLWLGRADLRTRVLSGIAARINSLSVSRHIARAFLNVVRQYLPDSGK